ncbi:hypothetical protein M8J76_000188 [Diaphorina citri]|nr:hypothetical protein M8J75_006606 [Diaphorina citri]KAI5740065.1 hypothetical protein M8J76_000188 [Diaphorina citri]KAI5746843.1 hypothetical protein M8J77_008066 [Diaphorina citri]
MKFCAKCDTYYELDQEVYYCDKCQACIHPDKGLTSVEVKALSLKARVLLTVLCDACRLSSTSGSQLQSLVDMENIGYQNDQNSEKQPTSSCNSSTAELHHTSRNSKAHLCDAERCSKKNNSSMPSPWHRLKSIFLSVLLVLFFLWILLLIVLINKNAL